MAENVYSFQELEQVKNQLEECKTQAAADQIFVDLARAKHKALHSPKNAFYNTAKSRSKKGDHSWIQLYKKWVNTEIDLEFSDTLSKEEIIRYIGDIENNQAHPFDKVIFEERLDDSVAKSFANADRGFLLKIFGTYLKHEKKFIDKEWAEYRFSMPVSGYADWGLLLIIGFWCIGLSWNISTLYGQISFGIALLYTIFALVYIPYKNFSAAKRLVNMESFLVEITNTLLIQRYPKDITNEVFNNTNKNFIQELRFLYGENKFSDYLEENSTGDYDYALIGVYHHLLNREPFNPYENYMLRHILLLQRKWLLDLTAYDDLKSKGLLEKVNTRGSTIFSWFK